ncbi:MAG: hypothetical protein JW944_13765 [Deltaproteobacteria bacterium]|nr:hypothetical protein [Deltaproteobacteria bacterium]
MDMYSKMEGTTPVSSALDGVWEIQKKRIDEKLNDKRKNNSEKKEEEEFEDGLVPREEEKITVEGKESGKERTDTDKADEAHSSKRKIDIII